MHATCHLMTSEGVLNPSLPRETGNRCTNFPSSEGSKWTMYGLRQIGLLGIHDINRDNIGIRAPLV